MIAILTAAVLALQSEELAEASKNTAALESYAFKVDAKAGKGKNQPGAVEGRYQKDQPTSLKTGSTEGFKKAGAIVYKDGEEWKQSDSFGRDDLPLVAKVADMAHTWIHERLQDKA